MEYKNVTNLNGPVYAIDLTEISSIKYENGGTDKFGEQSVVTTNAGQRTLTDGELMRMYNKMMDVHPGRGWKRTGIVLGSVGIIGGAVTHFCAYGDEELVLFGWGCASAAVAAGAVCYFVGQHKQHKVQIYSYSPLFQQDFQFGNSLLTADVNLINDNFTHDKSLGMGLRFTF